MLAQLFDVVITSARKPSFYTRQRSFRVLDIEHKQVQVKCCRTRITLTYSNDNRVLLSSGTQCKRWTEAMSTLKEACISCLSWLDG